MNIAYLCSGIINIKRSNGMKDVVAGINEDELSNLSLEVIDYADRISEIFDKIDACMDKLPTHYQGETCSSIINFYNELTPYYSIIKDNIISYSDDFIELIKKMQDNDKYLVSLFQNYTDDTIKKIKSIMD